MRTTSRPRSIPGLVLRLCRIRKAPVATLALLLTLVTLAVASQCGGEPVRVATFNIENYPRDARQVAGAFEAIRALDAPVVAVQEITDPGAFAHHARVALGPRWRFVASSGGPVQRVGVLYDGARFELAYAQTHDEPRLSPNGKPAFEVRLRRRSGWIGGGLRLFVVHLKAGGADHVATRREQLRQLAPIVRGATDSWDEVLVLGDFNATTERDREHLAGFARSTGLRWSSEPVPCSAYWDRSDGCQGSALDHVMSLRAARVLARGPCETEGCAPRDRCPVFHREVSDHCPVTADLGE